MCYVDWIYNKIIPSRIFTGVFSLLSLGIFLFSILFAGNSFASTDTSLSLLVNGKAIHTKKTASTAYNENNWGFGFQYEFAKTSGGWIPFAMASGFSDSNNQTSYYAGGGYMRRLLSFRSMDQLHLDAGLVGFIMSRQDYKQGDPFLGALPALSMGTQDVSVNVTYIPKVHPKIAELWFFQLKLSTRSLKIF